MTDEKRTILLEKGNSLIDKISESIRTVETLQNASEKILRPEGKLALSLPVDGSTDFTDMLYFEDIFSEKSIEKIKASILTEIEFLEEEALAVLDGAGIRTGAEVKAPEPVKEELKAEEPKKRGGARKPIDHDTQEKIAELTKAGKSAKQIAEAVGVSYSCASRYMNTVPAGKSSGRSVSKR